MRKSTILAISLLLWSCSEPPVQSTVSLQPPKAKLGATVKLEITPAPARWSGQITVMNATVIRIDSNNPSFTLTAPNGFSETGNTDLFVTLTDPNGYEIPLAKQGRLVMQVVQSRVTLMPSSDEVSPEGGSGKIHLTAADDYHWSAANVPDWVQLTPAAEGSGAALIEYKAGVNTTGQPRSARIGFGDAVFELTQPLQRSSGFKPFRTAADSSKPARGPKDKSGTGDSTSRSK